MSKNKNPFESRRTLRRQKITRIAVFVVLAAMVLATVIPAALALSS